ncbi:hypothetical protein LOD99_7387 [Oopsacas minuta]|uniref:Uncharacterized protein n=1 Tax=Oopsacas minuta TaxID=111878 RepID=A0AAV7JUH7_9METZ|nr:hypothetical protein LOD99_7387 [Oopsacas minuta]
MTVAVFFTIDKKGNFLITDHTANEIRIFSPQGVMNHILGRGHLYLLYALTVMAQKTVRRSIGGKFCSTPVDSYNVWKLFNILIPAGIPKLQHIETVCRKGKLPNGFEIDPEPFLDRKIMIRPL